MGLVKFLALKFQLAFDSLINTKITISFSTNTLLTAIYLVLKHVAYYSYYSNTNFASLAAL